MTSEEQAVRRCAKELKMTLKVAKLEVKRRIANVYIILMIDSYISYAIEYNLVNYLGATADCVAFERIQGVLRGKPYAYTPLKVCPVLLAQLLNQRLFNKWAAKVQPKRVITLQKLLMLNNQEYQTIHRNRNQLLRRVKQ